MCALESFDIAEAGNTSRDWNNGLEKQRTRYYLHNDAPSTIPIGLPCRTDAYAVFEASILASLE